MVSPVVGFRQVTNTSLDGSFRLMETWLSRSPRRRTKHDDLFPNLSRYASPHLRVGAKRF